MNISVSMYSLVSTVRKENWSVIDFIQYAKQVSLDGVELLDIFWADQDDIGAELKDVQQALKENNIKVSAYDVSNNFVKPSKEERQKEIDHVIEGIHTAKALGTNIVRVFCGDLSDGLTYEDGEQWIIDSLKECAKVAEEEKVYLAIENHGLLAGKSEQVLSIIERINSPYVKSTFDTGNFLLVHEDPLDAFNRLKDQIVHVHFKDFRQKEQNEDVPSFRSIEGKEVVGVIPGDGEVDLKSIVDGLKQVSYDGWLSIEYEGIEDAKEANVEAINRLRELIK